MASTVARAVVRPLERVMALVDTLLLPAVPHADARSVFDCRLNEGGSAAGLAWER
jgi:hypothetical protein